MRLRRRDTPIAAGLETAADVIGDNALRQSSSGNGTRFEGV